MEHSEKREGKGIVDLLRISFLNTRIKKSLIDKKLRVLKNNVEYFIMVMGKKMNHFTLHVFIFCRQLVFSHKFTKKSTLEDGGRWTFFAQRVAQLHQ